jgi:NAD(P)H-flavin reductase
MDMSGMTHTAGPFKPTNEKIALGYWYSIAGIVGLLTFRRLYGLLESRRRQNVKDSSVVPSRPNGAFQQAYATAIATIRELAYPQPVYFTGKISKYFTPLPVGRWLLLAVYWIAILSFLWTDTILRPSSMMYAYKWEKVGYRAAWVSASQIPFIYLLSCKFNPISLLTGISYERFNWLHRWAARTVFLTIIVHWSFFYNGWSIAGIVKMELEMMPMVKYGFGAWATIGWMILSGFGFFRNLSYEVFVAQHICAAATLLWLLYVHIPEYARHNVWMAVGFVAFDWISRIIWMVLRNTHILDKARSGLPGYRAKLEALPGDMVRIVVEDASFKWRAGQHIYISIPRLRPFEVHPFTIANACRTDPDSQTSPLTMVVKAHSGFSRRLYKAAEKSDVGDRTYRTVLSGPWGHPPDLHGYESVVLIACSSGASFTVPLLQELVKKPGCVRKVMFHWIIRCEDHVEWYKQALSAIAEAARAGSMRVQVIVHVTQPSSGNVSSSSSQIDKFASVIDVRTANSSSELSSSSGSLASLSNEKGATADVLNENQRGTSLLSLRYGSRPAVESTIRPVVESAFGETAVVVCGGVSITAQTRTFVAALSDERAVHKGSGAQGIFLFTETYGW